MKTSKFKIAIKLNGSETSVEIFAFDADAARAAVVEHFREHGERVEVVAVGPA